MFCFVVSMSHTHKHTYILYIKKTYQSRITVHSVMSMLILQSHFVTFQVRSGRELNWGQEVGKCIPPCQHFPLSFFGVFGLCRTQKMRLDTASLVWESHQPMALRIKFEVFLSFSVRWILGILVFLPMWPTINSPIFSRFRNPQI